MLMKIAIEFTKEELKEIEWMCTEYQGEFSPDIDHVSYELSKTCIKAQAKLED